MWRVMEEGFCGGNVCMFGSFKWVGLMKKTTDYRLYAR
jgi:hypothetical protein